MGEAQRGGWGAQGPELLQEIEMQREGMATSTDSAFSQELGRWPGGQWLRGLRAGAGTEPAKRTLERLEGFPGRKALQLY